MKFSVPGLLCLMVLCLPAMQKASAQGYHQLTTADFEGVPASNDRGVIAYTNCSIDFRYNAVPRKGYYLLNFTIRVILNKDRSWLDKSRVTSPEMMAEILKHEQGHYAIAYLEQQELLRAVGKTVFRGNYQIQAMAIFNAIDAKYKQLNLDYDNDTQHMVNRVQQTSWDMFFQKKLDNQPVED